MINNEGIDKTSVKFSSDNKPIKCSWCGKFIDDKWLKTYPSRVYPSTYYNGGSMGFICRSCND